MKGDRPMMNTSCPSKGNFLHFIGPWTTSSVSLLAISVSQRHARLIQQRATLQGCEKVALHLRTLFKPSSPFVRFTSAVFAAGDKVDVYGHLVPGSNRNAVNRLDDPEGTALRIVQPAGA